MYKLSLFTKDGVYFSTVYIWGIYVSEYNLVKQIEHEIRANTKHFGGRISWQLSHNNYNVTNWYLQTLGEITLAENEKRS